MGAYECQSAFTPVYTVSADMSEGSIAGYYNNLGQKLPQEPQSGVYIIKYNSGKAAKVFKK
jgi:hypothetical protein